MVTPRTDARFVGKWRGEPDEYSAEDDPISVCEFRAGGTYVLYEAALLVETGAYKAFSALVVVSAEASVQRLRLVARDGFTVEEANARINSQLPLEHKTAVADFVVTNNGNLDGTRRQVLAIHDQLCARFGATEAG
jgi:dephospho-CoA kinase